MRGVQHFLKPALAAPLQAFHDKGAVDAAALNSGFSPAR
jgi:hypothetical protein